MPIAGRLNRIEDNSVTTAKLVDDAVTTAKITDANVTKAKTETAIDDNIPLAWVSFKGTSTVTIEDDFNVSSITDNGTGDYTCAFSNNMASTNYTQAWDQKSDQASSGETNLETGRCKFSS